MTNHGPLLREGKAKRVYKTDKPETLIVEFKNDATAFNALKHDQFEGKGRLNCQISALIFEMLEQEGVKTHFLGLVSEEFMAVQHVEIIPIEVVLRNIAFGSLCKQTPIPAGKELTPALLDLYYKDDNFGDPLLTEVRLEKLGLVSPNRRMEMEDLIRRVNDLLRPFFKRIDLLLVDFKLELGVNESGQLLVADEISPDTCRLWDCLQNDPKDRILDKDRFRQNLGGLVEGYEEILKRMQGVCDEPRKYR